MTLPSESTREAVYELALARLDEMSGHHPALVLYSEAKVLYQLIPFLQHLLDHALKHVRNVDKQFLLADEKEILEMAQLLADLDVTR